MFITSDMIVILIIKYDSYRLLTFNLTPKQ
jgi:hypothetical protein